MKIPGLRWIIAFLLFTEALLAYLDLQEMSVLAPRACESDRDDQFPVRVRGAGISGGVYDHISSGGLVIDKLEVRWGLGSSIFCWSVANALHALPNTPAELAV